MAAEPSPLVITALGMATPLGLTADASCAAIRAGLTRFVELDPSPLTETDGAPLRVVVCRASEARGDDRAASLLSLALTDLARTEGFDALDPAQTALYLGLDGELASSSVEALARLVSARPARTYPLGHAAAVRALEEAASHVARGLVTRAVIAGVGSLVDAATMARLFAAGRLKAGDRPVGLFPGEAAAALLVEPLAKAEARGARVLAWIGGVATATEPMTVASAEPCDGTGLTEAARSALAALPEGGRRLGLVVCDLNGEVYRAEELAYARVRALTGLADEHRVWHPADCLGDVGAASAALAMGLAAHALDRGYARTSEALVWASSDSGLRGAVTLRAAPRGS